MATVNVASPTRYRGVGYGPGVVEIEDPATVRMLVRCGAGKVVEVAPPVVVEVTPPAPAKTKAPVIEAPAEATPNA